MYNYSVDIRLRTSTNCKLCNQLYTFRKSVFEIIPSRKGARYSSVLIYSTAKLRNAFYFRYVVRKWRRK